VDNYKQRGLSQQNEGKKREMVAKEGEVTRQLGRVFDAVDMTQHSRDGLSNYIRLSEATFLTNLRRRRFIIKISIFYTCLTLPLELQVT